MPTKISTGNLDSSIIVLIGSGGGPKITAITYPGNDTAVDTAGGQTVTVTGSGFVNNAQVIVNGSLAPVISFINSTSISFTTAAHPSGGYPVYIINPDGGTAIFVTGIQYSGVPTWTTAAGTIGSPGQNAGMNIPIAATGDAPVTYSLYSGSLPVGVTLNSSTGAISGTTPSVSVNTTYNFVVTATDAQNQDTNRSFSLTVLAMNPPPTVEYLVVAGGGGGGSAFAGGGGAGGLLTASGFAVAANTALTVTIGAGGTGALLGSYPSGPNGTQGVSSVFSSISTMGGGPGATYAANSGGNGGSGGGATPTQSVFGKGVYPGSTYLSQTRQGYDGGSSLASGGSGEDYRAGGGGGAGGAGVTAISGQSGAGGVGLQLSISGTATYYAGGGGGGAGAAGAYANPGAGGLGGGGAGGYGSGGASTSGVAGSPNTGGGAGGRNHTGQAENGGSGIVIIRYADIYAPAPATTGSPVITVAGGYRVYTWTSSGSVTF